MHPRHKKDITVPQVIQNAILVAIGSLIIHIAFHIAAKTQFGQLTNLSNAAVLSQIGQNLNHQMGHYSMS